MPINTINGLPGMHSQRSAEGSKVDVSRSEPTAKQEETGTPSSVDTVSLTDTAARLRKLESTIASLPVVDSKRVEDIQRAIANGSYQIDSSRIADKLLGFEAAIGS